MLILVYFSNEAFDLLWNSLDLDSCSDSIWGNSLSKMRFEALKLLFLMDFDYYSSNFKLNKLTMSVNPFVWQSDLQACLVMSQVSYTWPWSIILITLSFFNESKESKERESD